MDLVCVRRGVCTLKLAISCLVLVNEQEKAVALRVSKGYTVEIVKPECSMYLGRENMPTYVHIGEH